MNCAAFVVADFSLHYIFFDNTIVKKMVIKESMCTLILEKDVDAQRESCSLRMNVDWCTWYRTQQEELLASWRIGSVAFVLNRVKVMYSSAGYGLGKVVYVLLQMH